MYSKIKLCVKDTNTNGMPMTASTSYYNAVNDDAYDLNTDVNDTNVNNFVDFFIKSGTRNGVHSKLGA